MGVHRRASIVVLNSAAYTVIAATLVLQACEPTPCTDCDPERQFCQVGEGCRFLQNGNPNVLGEPTTYRCLDLPDACLAERTCECLLCGPAADRVGECGGLGECGDEPMVTQTFGCE